MCARVCVCFVGARARARKAKTKLYYWMRTVELTLLLKERKKSKLINKDFLSQFPRVPSTIGSSTTLELCIRTDSPGEPTSAVSSQTYTIVFFHYYYCRIITYSLFFNKNNNLI